MTRAAEERSQQIVADGYRQADEIRRGADEYAASVLIKLEGECIKALQSIKRGIALLDERHPQADDDGLEPGQTAEEEASSHAQL